MDEAAGRIDTPVTLDFNSVSLSFVFCIELLQSDRGIVLRAVDGSFRDVRCCGVNWERNGASATVFGE